MIKLFKKPFEFDNSENLRKFIEKEINSKKNIKSKKINDVEFCKDNILLKVIDYYYTNPIARSSKVMNDCRKISKNLNFMGIEKAN